MCIKTDQISSTDSSRDWQCSPNHAHDLWQPLPYQQCALYYHGYMTSARSTFPTYSPHLDSSWCFLSQRNPFRAGISTRQWNVRQLHSWEATCV